MPLFDCPSDQCELNHAKGNLNPQLRASKFLKFQEAKIQELVVHVPKGHIPRTMTVQSRMPGSSPGVHMLDKTCYMLPGLSSIIGSDIYNKLARSSAPEIYGHEDVKKALLLLLVGAPHRKLKDGMKIRGDLHICLMGDPGSSGVGLTAAVQKDPVTNEFVLEGGALVLADMGICAIDETAVLAAANPAWGRYDLRRTPAENIHLPPALLSRFDLLWLILDRADMDTDLEMARHVLHVHQAKESPDLGFTPLEPSVLRAYISAARKLSPAVPQDLEEYIASAYSSIRQEEAKSNTPHSYTTVRTLLSILRISVALARLRFSEFVAQSDVDGALRLMQMSKFSLYSDDRQRSGLDAISDIYSILRDEAARTNKVDVTYAHALNWISRKGYSEAQLKECLEEYAALNVWQIHPNTFDIRFIDA
ncbi:DNA replication licensing factor MCM7 [Striga hermonthica]|uniref:DNA helicase n=1 Tax=Striga hermonthica TaxID=68872 RepID=A0A9N7MIK2_STRHE|nr:DNA replication licensing factor MCM7 [Striga hermonthica]